MRSAWPDPSNLTFRSPFNLLVVLVQAEFSNEKRTRFVADTCTIPPYIYPLIFCQPILSKRFDSYFSTCRPVEDCGFMKWNSRKVNCDSQSLFYLITNENWRVQAERTMITNENWRVQAGRTMRNYSKSQKWWLRHFLSSFQHLFRPCRYTQGRRVKCMMWTTSVQRIVVDR